MRTIPLTKGQVATVDDEDFELVSKHKWYAAQHGRTFYAARTMRIPDRKFVYMHRMILGESELQVDHADGNGLNNTRSNMRLCTSQQNTRNQPVMTGRKKTSIYKGVHFRINKWEALIQVGEKKIHLGRFYNEIDAARAYDNAAKELFGEFARLNFPEQATP